MYEDSIFKVIINSIKNFFKIIITLFASVVTSLFGMEKKETKETTIQTNKKKENNKKKKKTTTEDQITTLPDEDNIKTNPHQQDDSSYKEDIILELDTSKIYKVYTKDNELKYLKIKPLLDLLFKEEIEKMYKVENFKMKTATTSEIIKTEKIKKRIFPDIIERANKDILRNSDVIRQELIIALKEDQLVNPLFPTHPQKTETIINPSPSTKEEEQILKSEEITPDTPKISIKDEIKNVTLVGATLVTTAAVELLTPTEEKVETKEEPTEEIAPKEAKPTKDDKNLQELKEEIESEKEKTVEELQELKEKITKKIEQIKEEKRQEEQKKEDKKDETVKDLVKDSEIIDVELATTALLEDSEDELAKEDFEERDYDKIERQIDKMLEDITNTYLKYEDKLTPKQKEKLKKEENKLREAKDDLYRRKDKDIEYEKRTLDETILEVEKEGLQKELQQIHKENEKEVSPELFRKMTNLEGMTKEQVANVDKRILLSRFRKANLALEISSLFALPFVRNKYFFYFTVGLIVDNHFNFINNFFNRKIERYEPADLEAIKRGQDALNGALDQTYKNIVELDYLEQRALARYPELAYDPRYVSQVTSLRTNLTKKYNKLMKKNQTMEKLRLKTKKQTKILKQKKQKVEETRR